MQNLKEKTAVGKDRRTILIVEAVILVMLIALFVYMLFMNATEPVTLAGADPAGPAITVPDGDKEPDSDLPSEDIQQPELPDSDISAPASPEPTPVPTPTPTPPPSFEPYCTEETEPGKLISTVGIQVDNQQLGQDEQYKAEEVINFGYGSEYTDVQGITTFRGNNFRDSASYGYANVKEGQLEGVWNHTTGSLVSNGEYWSGNGWTGQPLIVKWPRETKEIMNMYDWAKQDDELVEVIYASMDGNIYFLDLNSGKQTRDTLDMGYTFKGAGTLDPRGYPILYVGAGYDSNHGCSRAFVISLIDYSILYEFGNYDNFSLRGALCYFDAAPLVDAETDQLIWPGENGIVYIIKLNTDYDIDAGSLSISPNTPVKWHYYGTRTSLSSYWVGMEVSPVIWCGHLITADNGGNLMCLDLNTLELVWVKDILDDSNSTPVLSIEDGHPYIYVSTSYHYGWRSWTTCDVPIWKVDAITGETIWQTEYNCYTESGISGGVQSTIALGKNELEGRIYVTVAKTDIYNNGVLACIDSETGEILWEHDSYYTWSSPVLLYNEDGSGYVLYCTYGNYMYLLDGETGEVLDSLNLLGGVEASPAVYEDMAVIGTRQCLIWGVKIS